MVHLLKPVLLFIISIASSSAGSVTFSRGDREAYLTARNEDIDTALDVKSLDKDQFKHPPTTQSFPAYEDPQGCTLYIAESSIPDSGLGTYTTVSHSKDSSLGHAEIGIVMHDLYHHYPNSDPTKDLYKNYVWDGNNVAAGKFEASKSTVMIPGLGMIVNDYPGLTNVDQDRHHITGKFWQDDDDTLTVEENAHNTLDDAGRGSYASHSDVRYHAKQPIEAGDELFVSYGSGWFRSREHVFGPIPEAEHYKMAYETVKQFMDKAKADGLDITSLGMQQRYEERIYKADWLKDRAKLKAALPEHVSDMPTVLRWGAAAFSMKHNKRTVEWIETNGVCVDNIVAAKSTIPQAGKGAFASRAIAKGANIVTTPVITMTLNQLKLREVVIGSDWNEYVVHGGFQQILNYCYGHEESTLVFFPAAPAVNFINHGSKENANAEIRWSTSPYHKSEWLDSPLDEMKTKTKSGLMFDIVATKDIQRGDEILLYYGESWEESWKYQVEHFGIDGNFTDTLGLPTAQDLNTKERDNAVRTVFEQKTIPYPSDIDTACFFTPPEECEAPTDQSKGIKCEVDSNHVSNFFQVNLHPCNILSRHGGNGIHWYTANVTVTKPRANKEKGGPKRPKADKNHDRPIEVSDNYLVKYLPRQAIRFVYKPYSKDQYRKGAFRHPIGMGESMMPEEWLDLRRKAAGKAAAEYIRT